VLLIDDDEAFNYMHRRALLRSGVVENVVATFSAEEALSYLTNTGSYAGNGEKYPQPELIFLDINMPRMTGWDFLREYKKLPVEQRGRNVLVMLTTSLNETDEKMAKSIPEISRFIHKPLDMNVLQHILHTDFHDYF
jgi:CheY-like chemotaxis protein